MVDILSVTIGVLMLFEKRLMMQHQPKFHGSWIKIKNESNPKIYFIIKIYPLQLYIKKSDAV